MEGQLIRNRQNMKVKLPEIKKTLESVALLYTRHQGEDKSLETNFLVSDNIWAKAKISNESGRVGLWLGANVMVEYTFQEAIVLLNKNLKNAEDKLKEADDDIDFLKDNITTTEVNMARVYNQGVANKAKANPAG
jgi:prefoldin subunit 5